MVVVRAEIPATVWQVKVAVGDEVAVDDELIVLESMKMEIPVVAPSDGTIKVLHVKPMDIVAEGAALVELE